jgi:AraC family transcriptional regulator, transcriptional activator of pobA
MGRKKEYVPTHAVKTKEMRSLGIQVLELTTRPDNLYDSSVPHRHNYYEMFLFTSGTGHHDIDFKDHKITPGTIHLLSPGQIHTLHQQTATGYVVCFTADFLLLNGPALLKDRLEIFENSDSCVLSVPGRELTELTNLVKTLSREYSNNSVGTLELLNYYLNILLIKIKAISATEQPAQDIRGRRLIRDFKNLVGQKYLQQLTLSRYAKELGITSNYLNTLCREFEGKVASGIIIDRMMLEAKRLLFATDKGIQEIADYLGFQSAHYFSRWFKKNAGVSPADFRVKNYR